jgi:hypothetical protein
VCVLASEHFPVFLITLVGTINGQIWLFKLATQSSALPLLEIAAIAIVAVVIIVAILVFVFRKSIFKKQ